jgi:hypothetical protein
VCSNNFTLGILKWRWLWNSRVQVGAGAGIARPVPLYKTDQPMATSLSVTIARLARASEALLHSFLGFGGLNPVDKLLLGGASRGPAGGLKLLFLAKGPGGSPHY